MSIYADIIIDILAPSLDRTFQYRIPEELRAKVMPGSMVYIPFGNAKAPKKGYVISVSENPAIAEDKIKDIIEVITDSDTVESELLKVAVFISHNYGSTLAAALRVVFPVRKKMNAVKRTYLHISGDEELRTERLAFYLKKHQTARFRLLRELMRQEEIPRALAAEKLGATASVINALIEQGVCEESSERIYRNPLEGKLSTYKGHELLSGQQQAVTGVLADFDKGDGGISLIHGITGSGKTEVYIEIVKGIVERGFQAIVLIPEIALTYQTVMRFYRCFGDRVTTIHSRLSAGERYDQFERAKRGELDVVIGPRSALFAPFTKLGAIIIDEEHEGSYKSSQTPKYHAREVAIWRAAMSRAVVVLGSATPSVDSYYKAMQGEYSLYELTERAANAVLPAVDIVDLREELKNGNKTPISASLKNKIKERLERGEQTMLFLNRRGYAGFISCRKCGYVFRCPHCDVSLSGHRNGKLICHYCGYEEVYKKECPECGSKYVGAMKAGTEAIEKAVGMEFPGARILRMDMDTTKGKDDHEKIIASFMEGEADILIGTQMIVKGHDFPNVTLVGVIVADMSLHVPDFHAGERTFQLLVQAAGRAGRADKSGEVIIQTYTPDDPYIQASVAQDYQAFYRREIAVRELMSYPPAAHILCVLLEDVNQGKVEEASVKYAHFVRMLAGDYNSQGIQLQIIGPSPAMISYINDVHRRVFYVKCDDYEVLTQIKDALEKQESTVQSMQFDFDPLNGY